MCNNLNAGPMIEDVDKSGPTRRAWEENNHREKGMRLNEENFISQKGNFGEILLNKSYTKKIGSSKSR